MTALSSKTYLVPLGAELGETFGLDAAEGSSARQQEDLKGLGFNNFRRSRSSPEVLALRSVSRHPAFESLLSEVQSVIYAMSEDDGRSSPASNGDIRWLLHELALNPSEIVGLTPLNCSTFINCISIASDQLQLGRIHNSIVMLSGKAGARTPRVKPGSSVQSDGAASFLVTNRPSESPRYELLAHTLAVVSRYSTSHPEGRLTEAQYSAIKASRLRRSAQSALKAARETPADIDHVFVQNLGHRRMNGLAAACGIGHEKVWLDGLGRNGHVIGPDSIVNFFDAHFGGIIERDSTVMLVGTSSLGVGTVILRRET